MNNRLNEILAGIRELGKSVQDLSETQDAGINMTSGFAPLRFRFSSSKSYNFMVKIIICLLLILCVVPAYASGLIISEDTLYTVVKGDTIERIGARFGVDWRRIVKDNSLDIKKNLRVGQGIRVKTSRIVPVERDNGIVINIPDRMLYFFRNGKLDAAFPVGLGKPAKKGARGWTTPVGKFTILQKGKNPSWHVPESIQSEMAEEGKPVLTLVPPGPDNPLGRFAFKTSLQGIMIHETIWPGSVYQFRSHGCIRVTPEHMEKLFDKVEINTPGELIYMPVKAAVSESGRIFLELHRDTYGRSKDLRAEIEAQLNRLGVSARVDRQKIESMIKDKSGVAEDITL